MAEEPTQPESTYIRGTMSIRIGIQDLTAACRALGEVRVLAAGSMYATLHLNAEQLAKLCDAQISWGLDQ